MNNDPANEAKASFDHVYVQDTPHDYLQHLGRLDYSICDEARPFCLGAAKLVAKWSRRVRLLDIGCSYGLNAAVVRHGISFPELARFFDSKVPRDCEQARQRLRTLLERLPRELPMECGGLDVSAPAIRFAVGAGLLDRGIATDLETVGGALEPGDRKWVAGANLVLATGAIGYVTERTIGKVLAAMGSGAADAVVVLTVLRVFDPEPIAACLREHGLEPALLDGQMLPQRRFHDDVERDGIVAVLQQNGLDPAPEITANRHYARLLVAASTERLGELVNAMRAVAQRRATLRADPDRERSAALLAQHDEGA